MPTSLRDIPGATTREPLLRERRRVRLRFRRSPAPVLEAPSVLTKPSKRRRPLFEEHRHRLDPVNLMIAILAIGLVVFFVRSVWNATRVDVDVSGVTDGEFLTTEQAEQLTIRVAVDPADRLERAKLTFDGRSILEESDTTTSGFVWRPEEPVSEGEHVVEVTVPRPLLGPSHAEWRFTVDGTPPAIRVPELLDPMPIDEEVAIRGRVEPDARLLVEGHEFGHDGGEFTLEYPFPPAGPIRIDAYDPAGNHTTREVIVPVTRPETRAVHITPAAWDDPGLRAGILALIEAGRIDAVELDLKDEAGKVGHTSQVPLAREVAASQDLYDLADVVDLLHGRGVRVIGRLVAFRDPLLADAAWKQGRHDWVIQQPDGSPHPSYGGFTNFSHPDVRRYNTDLALEAARAGVDEILYDYIRRPEGPLEGMRAPGLKGSAEDSIVEFLAESHPRLRRAGVLQGASVFGIAADRPWAVAQDIPRIALHTDYVSPMAYPSLFVSGEYRVPDPPRQPYEIVKRTLEDFELKMRGTGARLVPWLQAFSLGPQYGAAEVRAQMQAAADLGIDSFLLWNPLARYSAEALEPVA